MCFYKIPWSNNAGIVNAYKTAFSYELIYQAPKYEHPDVAGGEPRVQNGNCNLFGNINPSHCGFGINLGEQEHRFVYSTEFGTTTPVMELDLEASTPEKKVGVKVEDYSKYYHIIATYDKSSKTELIALYIDGVKVAGSGTVDIGAELLFPIDYYASATNHTFHEENRTPCTEWLCIGAGSHQGGYGRFGAPNDTKIVVARVYGKALTPAEVAALYNYHKPE
jgi:hypothetical protein